MKKNILWFLSLWMIILLAGCSTTNKEQKQDFFIETQQFSSLNQQIFILKPGRVAWSQDIVVSSQVAGRIKSIEKKDWDIVSWEQLVIAVADTIANYWLQVQRAKSAVGMASLQSKQTQISIDKSLKDVSLALDVAKNNYDVAQQTAGQSLKQAELWISSADAQTQNIFLQFPIEKNNLLNLIDSVLHQVDTYLGVTTTYKYYNDSYEIYLSAKSTSYKTNAEQYLLSLYDLKKEIEALPSQVNDSSTVSKWVEVLQKWYDKTKQVLDATRDVFINSVSTATFSQSTIDWYKATIDGLISSLQWSKTAFVAYRKQITSLLSEWSQWSLTDLSKEQAQVTYDTTRINTNNAVFSTQAWVKNAETSYSSLLKNKDIQIGLARTAVYEASLSYQDALSRYNNLSVKAPIPGVIWNILVDIGQEVAPWTPLFTLSNNKQQTIEVYVTAEERWYLSREQFAKISYGGMEFTWSVLSVSSIAEQNTLYKVVVWFDDSVSILWWIASVQLPVSLPFSVLPLNVVTPVNENKWFVWTYDGSWIQKQTVVIWRIRDTYVEIFSWLSDWLNIVVNDVSYFDPSKFALKIKK